MRTEFRLARAAIADALDRLSVAEAAMEKGRMRACSQAAYRARLAAEEAAKQLLTAQTEASSALAWEEK
jgi:hypothetical protein